MLPADRKAKQTPIIAAEKIIADISSGVYRSPAAAIKELISNAYDADATRVDITTDAPQFRTLTIRDDGSGMDIEKFLSVLQHIGGSTKRLEGDTTPGGRKVIGRIGIGMLAVAQLSHRFYVSSTVKGKPTRFLAEVNLEPYHKDDASLRSMGNITKDGTVKIGAVNYVDDIPEDKDAHFTVITVQDAKKGLISDLTSTVRKAVGAEEKLAVESHKITSFEEIIQLVRSSQRADLSLDGYYFMLWELGLLAPVNYFGNGPFDPSARTVEGIGDFDVPKIQKFQVFVDGVELFRPQLFPNTRAINYSSPDPKIYPIAFDKKIANRRLRFSGYLYSQQPRIDPEELKGLHIRIRNVGIGKYDKSWLGYPFDEGIKFGQVTGEIFVEDGLEPALNIDRDSFRETDVHFQAIRAYLWDVLRKKVFPDFKARSGAFRKLKLAGVASEYLKRFAERLDSLPAPIPGSVKISKLATPKISSWISFDADHLIVDKGGWEDFHTKNCLASEDSQERFLRILVVLVSSEILTSMKNEEVDQLLDALAVAIE